MAEIKDKIAPTKKVTVTVDIPYLTYAKIHTTINLQDLLEKAIQDRIAKLLDY